MIRNNVRLKLHEELESYCANLYFQPPSNQQLVYPCIVYSNAKPVDFKSNNKLYIRKYGYRLTVIEKNPICPIAQSIVGDEFATYENEFVKDNLYHTILQYYNK